MTFGLTNYNNLVSLHVYKTPEEMKKVKKLLVFMNEIKQELLEINKEKYIVILSYFKPDEENSDRGTRTPIEMKQ